MPSPSKLGWVALLACTVVGVAGSARADEPEAPPPAVRADGTQRAEITTGVALAVVGPLSMIAGGTLTLFGVLINGSSDVQCFVAPCGSEPGRGTPLLVTGVSLLGLGLVSTVVGGVLLHLGLHPKVVPAPTAASGEADMVRRPIWNAERPLVPATPWALPLISTSF